MQDGFSVGKHFSAHPNRCRLESWLKFLLRKTKLSGTRVGVNAMELKSMLGGKRVKVPPGLLENLSRAEELRGSPLRDSGVKGASYFAATSTLAA